MTLSNFEVQLESSITCPECGHAQTETMAVNACWYFCECGGCGTRLMPLAGDCCVFCSYGSVPCPTVQEARYSAAAAVSTGGVRTKRS